METSELFDGYGPVAGFDEMFEGTEVRPSYGQVHTSFETMGADEVRLRADSLASSYLEQGVTFGVEGEERPFPLDIAPRLIEADDWDHVEQGVRQRVL
ncbi:MAG: circularly permuted type 2 ATP-grasp protein, partial [Aeromicrobium sp.]